MPSTIAQRLAALAAAFNSKPYKNEVVRYDAAQQLTDAQKAQACQNIGAIGDANVVHLNGAETITGAKTFQGAVVVPAPAANDDSQKAATTAWVRALVGTIADLEQESF